MKLNPLDYKKIVFFTGAGMSAESGVPTYRGKGGIWRQYNWEEYACQRAFEKEPEKVLRFHELRRKAVLECKPHTGHYVISEMEKMFQEGSTVESVSVVTQNIDGMHQRAGNRNVIELHGSLWRLMCPKHGVREDFGESYKRFTCETCDGWLRPDIVWFEDMLDKDVIREASVVIGSCDLFISIGTSGIVYPAAGFPTYAKDNGALCIEINPEASPISSFYDHNIRKGAGKALLELFENIELTAANGGTE
jgi:NAD-dependent deacetylase